MPRRILQASAREGQLLSQAGFRQRLQQLQQAMRPTQHTGISKSSVSAKMRYVMLHLPLPCMPATEKGCPAAGTLLASEEVEAELQVVSTHQWLHVCCRVLTASCVQPVPSSLCAAQQARRCVECSTSSLAAALHILGSFAVICCYE